MHLERVRAGVQPSLHHSTHKVETTTRRIVLISESHVCGTCRKAKPTVDARQQSIFLSSKCNPQVRPFGFGHSRIPFPMLVSALDFIEAPAPSAAQGKQRARSSYNLPCDRIALGSNFLCRPSIRAPADPTSPHTPRCRTTSGGPSEITRLPPSDSSE